MGLLTLQDVSLTYGDRELLKGISMVVGEGDRIGLLGPNGCGKSTLIRILVGIEQPDHGQRTTRRDLRIGYLEQEPLFAPELSIRDVVRDGMAEREDTLRDLEAIHDALAMAVDPDELESLLARQARLDDLLQLQGGHDVEHRIEAMVHDLGLAEVTARCGDLSGGERRRVALARVLLSVPDLLVLDEPTNHLDAQVTDWLEDYLLQAKCPLILVTHDRYFLDRLVNRTVEIEHGQLHEYAGGYAAFLTARANRLARGSARESTRVNLLRRESEWMRRGPPARSTKAKARIGRYEALVDAAPEKPGRELAFEIPSGPRLGERVIELHGVTMGHGKTDLLRDLDLEIGAGTRLGIVGPNGAGKTTFLDLCTGKMEPRTGSVARGSTLRFASIDQKRSDLDVDKSVLEEVAGANDYVHVAGRTIRVETFLEQFLFPGAMKHAKVGTLSGGERNRILLAKLLSAGGNVLVLDEPTNDLDLMTLRVLEEALCAFPGVVLVVSHDRYFLDRVATRILYLDGSGRHRVHAGDMSGLLEKLAQERAEHESAAAAAKDARRGREREPAAGSGDPAQGKASRRKLSTRERAELERLPDEIAAAEAVLAELDARLADPVTWQGDRDAAQALTASRDANHAALERLYRRWEELESIREAPA